MMYKTLNNGVEMPMLGFGVFQMPLEDPAFPRIFDHFDLDTVKWLLGDLVRDQQLQGASLY